MKRAIVLSVTCAALAWGNPPAGFKKIFNGKNLKCWHVSQVNHHGNAPWRVEKGVLLGTQDKPGNGGILLTDRKYRNFEVYLELNPDFGCDSGLFLRSSEKGEAYQVMLDYLEKGNMGGVYGERLGRQGRAGPGLAEALEEGRVELDPRPHRRRRAAHPGMDERRPDHRLDRHRQPRRRRRHRGHDLGPGARGHALDGGRLSPFPQHRGERAEVAPTRRIPPWPRRARRSARGSSRARGPGAASWSG